MNSSAPVNFLLDSFASAAKTASPLSASSSVNKQMFQQHYQTSLSQQTAASNNPRPQASPIERRPTEKQTAEKIVEKPAQQAQQTNGKPLPDSGEKVPLSKDAKAFLESLDDEDLKALLKNLEQDLQQLSADDLQKLQDSLAKVGLADLQQLSADELQQLQDLLAKGGLADLQQLSADDLQQLQDLLAKGGLADLQQLLSEETLLMLEDLAKELNLSLSEVQAGMQQLLQTLQKADFDGQRLASLQYEKGSGELKVLFQAEGGSYSWQKQNLSETFLRQEGGRLDNQEAAPGTIKNLVASLARGGEAGLLNQAGSSGDKVQQLLQAAGQGLGASPGSPSAAGRLAAALPGSPAALMSQATTQANAEALASRISLMQARGMQLAEMRLDPPDLGKLKIQIRMQGDQASIVMQSPNAQARDLLENALPRLRELLEEQGLSLTDASVSEEAFSEEGQQQANSGSGRRDNDGLAADDEEIDEQGAPAYFEEPLGLVDYYA